MASSARMSPESNPFHARFAGDPGALRVLAMPAVAEAVASGDPRRVHRALLRVRRGALSATDRADVERILADRRAFLRIRGSAPTLFTLNGIGTRFYGHEDAAHDHTYVGNRWVTLLYVPVFPLSSHLVRREGNGWRFYGTVPPSRGFRAKRAIVGGLLLFLVGWIAWGAHVARSYGPVRFLNGLDVAVTTEFGGRTLKLAPGARLTQDFSKGNVHVTTRTADGYVAEELDVEVPGGKEFAVYNVLGAAAMRVRDVVYVPDEGPTDATAPPDVSHAGVSWVVTEPVDYPFVTPPQNLRMHGARNVRRASYLESGGLSTSFTRVRERGGGSLGAFSSAILLADPEDDDNLRRALNAAEAAGGDAVRRLGGDLRDRVPATTGSRRAAQSIFLGLGEKDRLLAEQKALYEKDRTSAEAAYLYARLLKCAGEMDVVNPALAAHPQDRWLLRSAAWCAAKGGRHEEAADLYERLALVDPRAARAGVEERARSLTIARGPAEAQRVAFEAADRGSRPALLIYAKLARLPGADRSQPTVSDVVRRFFPDESRTQGLEAELAGYARDGEGFRRRASDIGSVPHRTACRICLDSAWDLSAAVVAARRADDETLGLLDDIARIALVCELLRLGDADGARRMQQNGAPALDDLRDPHAASADDELDAEVRATLLVAASRRAADPDERERLLAAARELDAFRCVAPR